MHFPRDDNYPDTGGWKTIGNTDGDIEEGDCCLIGGYERVIEPIKIANCTGKVEGLILKVLVRTEAACIL